MNVCAISGSLRAASLNSALLRAAIGLAPAGMAIHPFDRLAEIPPYNQDVESQGDPEVVTALKAAIRTADALLIATPEYNYGPPGVLKNALDWVSRPPNLSPLKRKPAALIGASMGNGGTIRAQLALRQNLLFTETYVMLKPEFLLAKAHEKFDAGLQLTDSATVKQLAAFLEALSDWATGWA